MASRVLGPAAGDLVDPAASLDTWLRVPDPARAAERLRVYVDGYPARLHESLAETYPAVAHLAGEDAFADLTHRYAAQVPQTAYNLNDAGASLPAFLRGDPLRQSLPFLPDLAELEWRIAEAFHAHERTPLDPAAMGWSMDGWAGAILHFQPSVAVVSSPWPVLALWAARDRPHDSVGDDRRDHCHHVLVRRAGLTVRVETVTGDEAHALALLLGGRRLAEATELLHAHGCDPTTVSQWFSGWVAAGMIADATV